MIQSLLPLLEEAVGFECNNYGFSRILDLYEIFIAILVLAVLLGRFAELIGF
jgi:hypothetical protein